MRLDEPRDPALEAASLALGGRRPGSSNGFASIELRDGQKLGPHLAPLGYLASVLAGLITVAMLWAL